jgi:hypothetical protein
VLDSVLAYVGVRTIQSILQINVTNTDSKTKVIVGSWSAVQGNGILLAKRTSTTHTLVTLNSSYKYRVRAYRTYGITRIYSAYSAIQTVLVQYSTDELLANMSSQLNALSGKVTSQPVKDIILFTKGSIDATRLDPTHDYRADVLTAKIMFHGLTTSQKAEIILAVILNINGSIIQLLDQRFDVD